MNGPHPPKAPTLFKGPDSNGAVIETKHALDNHRGEHSALLCRKTGGDDSIS